MHPLEKLYWTQLKGAKFSGWFDFFFPNTCCVLLVGRVN